MFWRLKIQHQHVGLSLSAVNRLIFLGGVYRSPDDRFSGNGGLSLRRVSAIQQVLGFQQRFNDSGPEDEWFGKRLWVLPNHKVASGSDGRLAVEDVYFENAMGYHVREGKDTRDEVWKSYDQRKKIFEYCPELSLIMDMKLERERCDWDTKQTPPEGKSVDEWVSFSFCLSDSPYCYSDSAAHPLTLWNYSKRK